MCLHVTFIPIIAKIGGVLTWSPAHPSQLLLFLPAADGLRLGQPGAGKMAALIWKNEFCWAKWGKMSWNFREFWRILLFSSWEFSSSLSSTHLCPVSPIAMRSGAAHWRMVYNSPTTVGFHLQQTGFFSRSSPLRFIQIYTGYEAQPQTLGFIRLNDWIWLRITFIIWVMDPNPRVAGKWMFIPL